MSAPDPYYQQAQLAQQQQEMKQQAMTSDGRVSTEAVPRQPAASHAMNIAAAPAAAYDGYAANKPTAMPPSRYNNDAAVANGTSGGRRSGAWYPFLMLALLSVISLLVILVVLAGISFHQLKNNAVVSLSSNSVNGAGCTCAGAADTVSASELASAIANLANVYSPNADAQLERESTTVLQDPANYSSVFDFNLAHETDQFTPYGYSKIANIENYPATHNQAISQTLFQLEPNGCNSPHHHPEAVEILFVFQGTINVTRVEPNGGTTYSDTLHENMTVLFPRGHIHFQHNIGPGVARYISTLNSELPGVMSEAQRICNLPLDVLMSMWPGQTATSVWTMCGNNANAGPVPATPILYKTGTYPSSMLGALEGERQAAQSSTGLAEIFEGPDPMAERLRAMKKRETEMQRMLQHEDAQEEELEVAANQK